MTARKWNRRQMLRGAGLTLSLGWRSVPRAGVVAGERAPIPEAKGLLKTDRPFSFGAEQRLAALHLTIVWLVFAGKDAALGASRGIIPELLA